MLGVKVERVAEATSNVITNTACQLGDPRGESPLELVAPGDALGSDLASRRSGGRSWTTRMADRGVYRAGRSSRTGPRYLPDDCSGGVQLYGGQGRAENSDPEMERARGIDIVHHATTDMHHQLRSATIAW